MMTFLFHKALDLLCPTFLMTVLQSDTVKYRNIKYLLLHLRYSGLGFTYYSQEQSSSLYSLIEPFLRQHSVKIKNDSKSLKFWQADLFNDRQIKQSSQVDQWNLFKKKVWNKSYLQLFSMVCPQMEMYYGKVLNVSEAVKHTCTALFKRQEMLSDSRKIH